MEYELWYLDQDTWGNLLHNKTALRILFASSYFDLPIYGNLTRKH